RPGRDLAAPAHAPAPRALAPTGRDCPAHRPPRLVPQRRHRPTRPGRAPPPRRPRDGPHHPRRRRRRLARRRAGPGRAPRRTRGRGRGVWILTVVAEVLFLFDVVVGTALVAAYKYKPPGIHMFYGFLVFITVGLAFQYRESMRGRTELLYGLVGLFLMGLGIRAVFQVV